MKKTRSLVELLLIGSTIGIVCSTGLLVACKSSDRIYDVRCEDPFYKGEAKIFSPSDGWTLIITPDGTEYKYPGSVKCEAVRRRN